MNSLVEQPYDHKNFIFSSLNLSDLKQLGFVCKDLYHDTIRKKWLLQRVVDSYFYKHRVYNGCVLDWKEFEKQYSSKEFFDLYFSRLEKIGIQDLKRVGDLVEWNNNGLVSRCVPKAFRRDIQFFTLTFEELEEERQMLILTNLFQYLFDLWKYADKNNQNISKAPQDTSIRFFDFYYLYDSIHYFLQKIFVDVYERRYWILNQLVCLQEKTKDSSHSKPFDAHQFIRDVDECDPTHLNNVIDIGTSLMAYEWQTKSKESFLYHYLYQRYNLLMDLGFYEDEESKSLDCYMEDFIQDLNSPFDFHKTKKEKLFELFDYANYMIHDEFENALYFRFRRWNGEIQTDSEEEEQEDYDY